MALEDEAGWDDLKEVILEEHRTNPQKELLKRVERVFPYCPRCHCHHRPSHPEDERL